jgi:hypothetical protein
MKINQLNDGKWVIHHGGHVIAETFATERDAERWADHNIDDQVFDNPNCFMPPLVYLPEAGGVQ